MTQSASPFPQIAPIDRTPHVLGKPLGKGGYSVVFRARPVGQRKTIAIKVLRPALAEERRYLEQFKQEARYLAILAHASLPAFIEAGQWASGHYYIAMEQVGSRNLEEVVETYGPLSVRNALLLGAEISEAVGYLHHKNLRHGDIKPSNILMPPAGRARLVDLGLTTPFEHPRTREIFGTPAYLSPEQISGESLGELTDVYSLGAVLYFALTGAEVFAGKSVTHVCHQHLHSEPIAPSLRGSRPIPQRLERLVLKCLSKDPSKRPTIHSLQGELRDMSRRAARTTRSQNIA